MKRRNVLKSVGTGVIGAAGLASAGASAAEIDAATAEGALADHRDLLGLLARDGVIESADPGAFDLETRAAPGDDSDGVARLSARLAGEETTMIAVSKRVARGRLDIGVLPEFGAAFAVIRDGDRVVDSYRADVDAEDPVTGDGCPFCELCYCEDPCSGYCCKRVCYCMKPPCPSP